MFDLSWTEIALLVVVALIFIGPKDLPVAMRTLSKGIRAIRRMASEFQQHLDEMVREADLSETREQLRELRQFDLRDHMRRMVDPQPEVSRNPMAELPPHEGVPRVPSPPEAPSFEDTSSAVREEQPYNERMKARAEALECAPVILPPTTALRLIEESSHLRRPAILPPEIALHSGKRVPVMTDVTSIVPAIPEQQEEDHGRA